MSEQETPQAVLGASLDPQEREALDRVLACCARNADAIEQAVETVGRLADTGLLAAANGVLEDFDESFSATVRPELMGMVANLMMVLGTVSQLRYEPFFNLAMKTPPVMNEAWPRFQARETKLSLRETLAMMRRPEMAAAIELLAAVVRAQRDDAA
jgi:uncharacterized protein YjgD (DUF1641 family)